MLITFEGIDGSGKSTQARALASHLAALGREAVLTREPGGSDGAEDIRKLLVSGEVGRWSPETEILLFYAARRDHLERLISPSLAAGKFVICDRFADSTRVYQGAVRADLRAMVDQLHKLMIGIEPDLTVILDADPSEALNRGLARGSGEDRFEDMGLAFQMRLRQGFLDLAKEFPDRCVVVAAQGTQENVAARILDAIQDRLP